MATQWTEKPQCSPQQRCQSCRFLSRLTLGEVRWCKPRSLLRWGRRRLPGHGRQNPGYIQRLKMDYKKKKTLPQPIRITLKSNVLFTHSFHPFSFPFPQVLQQLPSQSYPYELQQQTWSSRERSWWSRRWRQTSPIREGFVVAHESTPPGSTPNHQTPAKTERTDWYCVFCLFFLILFDSTKVINWCHMCVTTD